MTKKAYTEAPAMRVVQLEVTALMTGSPRATVDGTDALDYDPTEGNAGNGLSRRRRKVWDDEMEEEEDYI